MTKVFKYRDSLEIDFTHLPLGTYTPAIVDKFWECVQKKNSIMIFPLDVGPIISYDAPRDQFAVEFGSRSSYHAGMKCVISAKATRRLLDMIHILCSPSEGSAKVIVVTGPSASGKTTFIQRQWPGTKTALMSYSLNSPWGPSNNRIIGDVYVEVEKIPQALKNGYFPSDSIVVFDGMWHTMRNNEEWQAWLRILLKQKITLIFEEQSHFPELKKLATETYNGPFRPLE